ncbi:MAG: PrpC [Bacillales bacterium]|jgi:serine/threonine protein phosphatase PrpC|nr:PrpC [Bacillales bacterium]
MTYIISAITDRGNFKTVNQDAFYVKSTTIGRTAIVFGIVCDGLGGLSDGEFASSYVVQSFVRWFESFLKEPFIKEINFNEICKSWDEVLQKCNNKLINYGERRDLQSGTTMNAILIIKNQYLIANIGDSRAYSIIKRVKQITKDHSFINQEVENGRLSRAQAKIDPRQHLLTKCVGVYDCVAADFYLGKIKGNQTLIHCSDGFYKEVSEREIVKILEEEKNNGEIGLNRAVTTIVEIVKTRGEKDNITVLVIKKEKLRFL